MKLSLNLKEEPFLLEVSNESGNVVTVDAAESIGGTNRGLRPMELLASSLASCLSIDVLLILRKQRQPVTSFLIDISAKRKAGEPSPFEEITLTILLNPEVTLEKAEAAVNLSKEKYCSVIASLHSDIRILTNVKHKF